MYLFHYYEFFMLTSQKYTLNPGCTSAETVGFHFVIVFPTHQYFFFKTNTVLLNKLVMREASMDSHHSLTSTKAISHRKAIVVCASVMVWGERGGNHWRRHAAVREEDREGEWSVKWSVMRPKLHLDTCSSPHLKRGLSQWRD